jgi:hypothetical protein
MEKRSKIVRMDDWDRVSAGQAKGKCLRCDFADALRLHAKYGYLYYSLFKRSKEGVDFDSIKQSEVHARIMAERACSLIDRLLLSLEGWCIVTAPRRRHFEGFNPEFYLLRNIPERKVIIFDDIITTGMTLTATRSLFLDREQVVCIVGIHNN